MSEVDDPILRQSSSSSLPTDMMSGSPLETKLNHSCSVTMTPNAKKSQVIKFKQPEGVRKQKAAREGLA
jgi:hypothetical protein